MLSYIVLLQFFPELPYWISSGNMAEAEALAKKLALGSSELWFLLVHHKVSDEIQGELYQNGIDTVAKFAASAIDEADLKAMLKDSLAIDPVASLKMRALAARVVVSWKTAITRSWSGRKPRLPARCDTAKPIPSTDYIAMKTSLRC